MKIIDNLRLNIAVQEQVSLAWRNKKTKSLTGALVRYTTTEPVSEIVPVSRCVHDRGVYSILHDKHYAV